MKVVVDRFEEGFAVLLFGEEGIRVDFPKELLPEGIREGSCLKANFELDHEGTRKQEDKIGNLLDRLKRKNK
jgi:hypothetical protein